MQTFLPAQSYFQSSRILDDKRLIKQRVECKQILLALDPGSTSGWRRHPAVRMWRGYENELALYALNILLEFQRRGFKDKTNLRGFFDTRFKLTDFQPADYPPWLTNEFCSRHRAALLAKDFEFYKKYNWIEEPKIDYIWPV